MPAAPTESIAQSKAAISPHTVLISALAGADPEPILERAIAQLGRGGDLALLLATAAALARCGLGGIATRLLMSAGTAASSHPHALARVAELRHAPAGAVPADVIAARFRTNASTLLERLDGLRPMLDPSQPPRDVTIYRSRAGNLHAMCDRTDGRLQFIFPFLDSRSQAAAMKLPRADLDTSIALIGVPSMALLERLVTIEVGGYCPPIDIIETDLAALRVWLCMLKDAGMLADDRIHVFVGSDATSRYATQLVASGDRGVPTMILTNHRPGWTAPKLDEAWRREVAQRSANRRAQFKHELDQRLRTSDAAHRTRRFCEAAAGTRSLQIVGFTNRYSTVVQHAMQRLAAAFERAGHRFEVAGQANDHTPGIDVAGVLAQRECDLIVAINHLRFEYADSIPANVPFVGWIQDHMDHLWRREAGASISEQDLVITHAPDVLSGLYGYRRERMLASSNLTDANVFSAEPLPKAELEPHRCDLSFVSHGAATAEALVDEIAQATTPAFGRLLREAHTLIRQRLEPSGCLNAQELVEVMLEAERASGHPALPPDVRRAVVYPHVGRIHDRVYRHQTLEWAVDWARSRGRRFRIYGRGWAQHPTLSEFAAGEAVGDRALRAVYQASRLNLQANAYSSLHQRLLDGVACGAMVISRYNPADFVRQAFVRLRESIMTHDLNSLAELAALRRSDVEFAAVCDDVERLSSVVLATLCDPARREQARVLREANDIAELQTDEGLFAVLRDLRYLPARAAGEIPGFEQTVFRDEQQMPALLDRLVDDQSQRQEMVRRMRDDVTAHDTVDSLARRIIDAFASGAAS